MRPQPKPRQAKPKIAIYLEVALLKALNQRCLDTTGTIKYARSVFVIQAIKEKLTREGNKKRNE